MHYSPNLVPVESDFVEWLVMQEETKRRITIGSSTHNPVDILANEDGLYDVLFARWKGRVKGGVHLDSGKPRQRVS